MHVHCTALVVEHLMWSDENEAKLNAHGITRAEVVDVIVNLNYIVFDSPYISQVRVVGYTSSHRWLTLAMEELGQNTFRPITGWTATDAERERFGRAEQGLE